LSPFLDDDFLGEMNFFTSGIERFLVTNTISSKK